MFIALYDENIKHIGNLDNVTYDLTQRVYDNDNFSAEGVCEIDINDAKIAILNDNAGNMKYACFVNTITPDNDKKSIKGLDFKSLWDTEILLDYTAESFDSRLSAIFTKIKELIFDSEDVSVNKIPIVVNIPTDTTDTTAVYGSYQGTYQITNAYKFLKCYLKYYEYNIESYFDISTETIVFNFVKTNASISVDLNDFISELTTNSNTINKAVATIKYDVETPETDADGNIIYSDIQKMDADGNPVVDDAGKPVYIPKYKSRPSSIATKYYYRDKNNNIVQADALGDIENRIYPVQSKMFEAEYLADAQFNAVYELANARYVDNIIIDNNDITDPINLVEYSLYTKVNLYYGGKLYKILPISEKTTSLNGGGLSTKIKLGFKKILLTEIIKN